MADEAINLAAKELLRLISNFQARMKEKNPQKAKQKLRFVAGLKQVIRVHYLFTFCISFIFHLCLHFLSMFQFCRFNFGVGKK